MRFTDAKTKTDYTTDVACTTPITDRPIPVDWAEAQEADFDVHALERQPAQGASFGALPPAAAKSTSYTRWSRDFVDWLFANQRLELYRSPSTKATSMAGESERDFRVRLGQIAREHRDSAAEALRKKYASRMTTLQDRIRRAEQAVERQQSQARQSQMQTAISVGATLLSAFTGRKATQSNIGRATTAVRGVGRSVGQQSNVGRARDNVSALQQQLAELEAEFQAETDRLASKIDPLTEELEVISLKPRKMDISVQLLALTWSPYRADAGGFREPAW